MQHRIGIVPTDPTVASRVTAFRLGARMVRGYFDFVRRMAPDVRARIDDPAQRPWARVIIEKPFGSSLGTARALNQAVLKRLAEHQVYRIDHYLGKETVQNILAFRFANALFEPIWDRRYIDHVAITVAESGGIGSRGGYYEQAGALRDMVQNHILQLLCLTAMEPPWVMNADVVRDHKLEVLNCLRPIHGRDIDQYVVRAQYGPGFHRGVDVPGYRREPGVSDGRRKF